jgi:hypothetical protein
MDLVSVVYPLDIMHQRTTLQAHRSSLIVRAVQAVHETVRAYVIRFGWAVAYLSLARARL